MTRADRRKTTPGREVEPMRPRQAPWRTDAGDDDAQEDVTGLGGRVWALRCAGVMCEAPSPDRPDHHAPALGYMRASIHGQEEPWVF